MLVMIKENSQDNVQEILLTWELYSSSSYQATKFCEIEEVCGYELQGLRPQIPRHTHPKLVELLHWCWHQDSSLRPNFSEILEFLPRVTKTVCWGESWQFLCYIKKNNWSFYNTISFRPYLKDPWTG